MSDWPVLLLLFLVYLIGPVIGGLHRLWIWQKTRPYPNRGKRFRKCFRSLRSRAWAAGLAELRATHTGLAGKAEGLEVRLDRQGPQEVSGTRIVISGLGHPQPGLNLQSSRIRVSWDKGINTGDAAFDAQVRVGSSMLLLARA